MNWTKARYFGSSQAKKLVIGRFVLVVTPVEDKWRFFISMIPRSDTEEVYDTEDQARFAAEAAFETILSRTSYRILRRAALLKELPETPPEDEIWVMHQATPVEVLEQEITHIRPAGDMRLRRVTTRESTLLVSANQVVHVYLKEQK